MSLDANESSENYSKSSVIGAYLFFGGAIGGGLIGLIIAIFLVLGAVLQNAVLQNIVRSIVLALLTIPSFAFFGFIVGLIPATLTGCLVAYFELYRNHKGLSQSAIIGAISTVICTLMLIVFSDFNFSLAACIFATLIGSASGYLTGLFTLPKA
ncbi:hypothetical protein [Psychrobacter sp.]|uniref:hypothetical protein n=1 Tax=Psychrobacter sp. TaxID=56811 RepID=UPI002FDAA65A